MHEGLAVAKPPAEDAEPSNVVPFPVRAVDYTGSALKLMTGLAKNVNDLRIALDRGGRDSIKPNILKILDQIIHTMEMIEAHMEVIDVNSEKLKDFIEPGGNAYFSSQTSELPMEIISLIERRQATLMVQRFIFRAADNPQSMFDHDNDHQVLLTHEGCVACQWPRSKRPSSEEAS